MSDIVVVDGHVETAHGLASMPVIAIHGKSQALFILYLHCVSNKRTNFETYSSKL